MTLAPIFSLLIILVLSLLVTRVATVALTFTGLAQESARFQARSAFTGVGFTSKESENVLNHPVRRRIIMLLMLSGNVGIVTVVASLVLTLGDIVGPGPWLPQLALLAAGIGLLTLIATSRWVNHRLSSLIAWALRQWTTIDVHDYANLLHLCGEYGIVETPVGEGKWLADTTLGKLSLGEEGVLVLGVQRRDGGYVGGANLGDANCPRGHPDAVRPHAPTRKDRRPTQ